MTTNQKTKPCFFCKSEIDIGAIKCNHCLSNLSDISPSHKGKCTFCKSVIDEEALKCKYCKSWLIANFTGGINFTGSTNHPLFRMAGPHVFEDSQPGDAEMGYDDDFGDPPPQAWVCKSTTDWSTYNPRTQMVGVRTTCTEIYSGATRSAGIRYRRVSKFEREQWLRNNA